GSEASRAKSGAQRRIKTCKKHVFTIPFIRTSLRSLRELRLGKPAQRYICNFIIFFDFLADH
ncbi:MAG: hypothetical protein PHD48_11395, partial [Alphaproteobacteria bacterium]|nr:hypothetical protein [Alphaproteobacteria bacterium]